MKKLFGALLVVGLTAGAANAARIGVEWNAATSSDAQTATIFAGGTGQFDMVTALIAGESLSTVAFEFNAITGDPVSLDGTSTNTVGDFVTNVVAGPLGGVGVQTASASADPLNNALSGPGSFVLGTYDLSVDGGAALGDVGITIHHPNQTGPPSGPLVTVLNQGGGSFTYNNNNAGPGAAGTQYSGYYAFGIGSPATLKASGQAANPLNLTITPEPASLVLLAFGGIALLRRR